MKRLDNMKEKHAVTGAFGYSGKYIAQRLLDEGHEVITLTNSLKRENPFGSQIRAFPFNFHHPDKLTGDLTGVSVLYNTYWVRFNHRGFTFAEAVKNSCILFSAAKAAGIRRVVHISITNPSPGTPLEYFRGKALLEKELRESGLSYAILRPAVLFGKEDILINNIAWALRRFPVFGIFGDGEYQLQPIYVDDLASLAVEQGARAENVIIDAIGPQTLTYREMVKMIGEEIGKTRPLISVPPPVAYWVCRVLSLLLNDVIITRDEMKGLMSGLLCVESLPAGSTRLSEWIRGHADSLGRTYTSELARRRDRLSQYRSD